MLDYLVYIDHKPVGYVADLPTGLIVELLDQPTWAPAWEGKSAPTEEALRERLRIELVGRTLK
jgi:hypothetical protein